MARYALGLDYGTNSVRALLVDIENGAEVAEAVYAYPSGDDGVLYDPRDPNLARQNPADYVEGFYATTGEVLRKSGLDAGDIVGVGVDTTGSTPIPVDRHGTPLSMDDRLKDDLGAYAWLWKDHTSHAEAAEITERAQETGEPYLAKCGGTYSSEWFWSKILHCSRVSPEAFAAAYSWVECADWIPAYLTGNTDPHTLQRGVCAAGHKAMYAEDWGGLPSKEFLGSLSPALADLRDRLYEKAVPSDQKAGGIGAEVASRSGLREGTPVAVGAFDAHLGAVGSGVRPGTLVKIIGTSTCDCMVHPLDQPLADIPGVSGIVKGSILPDQYGLEAGQSAVGDIFEWFVSHLAPPGATHESLTAEAECLRPGESGLLALDWNNGNRTILTDPLLTGLLLGQTLHTSAAEVYRALVEATAFGSLKIIRRIEEYGVEVREGRKLRRHRGEEPVHADLRGHLDRPLKISRLRPDPALGSAVFASVVGGGHATVQEAQRATWVKERIYTPDPHAAAALQTAL